MNHLTRRTFLSTAALALPATHLLVRSEPAAPRRFNAGFLGASYSHARDKIRLIQNHRSFELIGATDDSQTVRDMYPNVHWMGREELLDRCEVIFVESEVRDHARDGLAALRAGRHLHIEKPPSLKFEEVEEMIRIAREKKLLFQTGYMWRYHPGFDAIFEAVRQGWLGRVYQVQGVMNNQLPAAQRAEWAEFKGGSFFEQASHLIDVLIRLLGKPEKVTSFLHSTANDGLVDNNAAVFEFPDALGIISNATNQPNASTHRSFEVRGTQGTMLLKPIEPPSLMIDLAKPAGPYPRGLHTIPLPPYSRYAGEIDDFAAALASNRPLKVSLDDELRTHEWLLRSCGMF